MMMQMMPFSMIQVVMNLIFANIYSAPPVTPTWELLLKIDQSRQNLCNGIASCIAVLQHQSDQVKKTPQPTTTSVLDKLDHLASIFFMSALPKTSSKKTDRKATTAALPSAGSVSAGLEGGPRGRSRGAVTRH
jgi:hypothetical protein